jgi:hypothetical protein
MIKIQMTRSRLAIATNGTLCAAAPVTSQARELRPSVVSGSALDNVPVAHPTSEYPASALQVHINGHVQVTVKVQNGGIVGASASADSTDHRACVQRMDPWVLEV